MLLEIAILPCRDGDSAGMIRAMAEAGTAALLETPGCHSVRVLPGVEEPGTVAFLVEWESLEAHDAARETEPFARFKAAAGPFFGDSAIMHHFRLPG